MNTELCNPYETQTNESSFENLQDLSSPNVPKRSLVRRRIDFMMAHTHAAFVCSTRKVRVVVCDDGVITVEDFCKKVFRGEYDSQLG